MTADGVAYDSSSGASVGALHEHQQDMVDDIDAAVRAKVSKEAFARGCAVTNATKAPSVVTHAARWRLLEAVARCLDMGEIALRQACNLAATRARRARIARRS